MVPIHFYNYIYTEIHFLQSFLLFVHIAQLLTHFFTQFFCTCSIVSYSILSFRKILRKKSINFSCFERVILCRFFHRVFWKQSKHHFPKQKTNTKTLWVQYIWKEPKIQIFVTKKPVDCNNTLFQKALETIQLVYFVFSLGWKGLLSAGIEKLTLLRQIVMNEIFSESYSRLCHTSEMGYFAKLVISLKLLNI